MTRNNQESAHGARRASPELATSLQALASIVYEATEYEGVYQSICLAAPRLVPGCDHASLMIRQNGDFVTAGASDAIAREIDAAERLLGEGPCVDAIVEEAAQLDADLTDGSEWPAMASHMLAHTPVRGVAGFRLVVDDRKAGALNLFSDSPGALSVGVDHGAVLAAFASVALMAVSHRENADSLRRGLASNREIGKAVGLMMAFHKVSDDEAFELLRRTSQDMNLKIADVAKEIVTHHNRR